MKISKKDEFFTLDDTLRFPFSSKNSLIWRVKCEKLNFRKSWRIYKISSKIVRECNGHLKILSLPQGIENSRQFLLLRTDILQKPVVGWPCFFKFLSKNGNLLPLKWNVHDTCIPLPSHFRISSYLLRSQVIGIGLYCLPKYFMKLFSRREERTFTE